MLLDEENAKEKKAKVHSEGESGELRSTAMLRNYFFCEEMVHACSYCNFPLKDPKIQ